MITFSTNFNFNYHVEEKYNAFITHVNIYSCSGVCGLVDVARVGRVDSSITRSITSS